jgi:hypothetical protein
MTNKIILTLSILFLAYSVCSAQKKVIHDNQEWLQYYNQLKFSEKLILYTDISLRRINNFNDWSQITFRTGLGYSLIENLQAITGLAFFTFYTQNKLSKIELRPYQEFSTLQTFGNVTFQHRFRAEARYFRNVKAGEISDTTDFNFRFRYRLYSLIPIIPGSDSKPNRKLFLNLGDEIFINAGKEILYNMFDNNRFIIGTTYQHDNNLSFSLGYINQFGQRNNPATYENSDILTLGIIQKISLQKSASRSP